MRDNRLIDKGMVSDKVNRQAPFDRLRERRVIKDKRIIRKQNAVKTVLSAKTLEKPLNH